MTFQLPAPGVMTVAEAEGADGKAMMEAVKATKAAIEKFLGKECDIAIAVHPHHGDNEHCTAMGITPEGMPIQLAAQVMWKSLGALQMIMAEMPQPGDTRN